MGKKVSKPKSMLAELGYEDNVRLELLTMFDNGYQPGNLEMEVKRILDKEIAKGNKRYKGVLEKHGDLINKAIRMYEFGSNAALIEATPEKKRTMVTEFYREIRKEYKCNNSIEESLAETIALNFMRVLHITEKITHITQGSTGISEQEVKYYNFLSKELDRANRHYLSAVSMLQQLKSPTLKVNLKAETAIVGQNQQFNKVEQPISTVTKQHENNKP